MKVTDHLTEHFSALGLPGHASQWLLDLYDVIQTFDDYADNDQVSREALDSLIWHTLIGMPSNPFYREHTSILTPLLAAAILKWQASDFVERQGNQDEKSFMWRAGYYDIVLMVVQLIHGTEFTTKNAHLVLRLYGEELSDYLKEFGNA